MLATKDTLPRLLCGTLPTPPSPRPAYTFYRYEHVWYVIVIARVYNFPQNRTWSQEKAAEEKQ